MVFRKLVLAAGLLGLMNIALEAAEPSAMTVKLDIQAQPLGDALNEFGRQAGLQVVLFSAVGEGVTAPHLTGSYSAEEALKQLLANTSLSYEFINERTVAIRKGKPEAAAKLETVGAATVDETAGIRLAQADATSGTDVLNAERQTTPNDGQEEEGVQLEEIVVTGTHIRGTDPVGSNLTVIRQEDIRRSGYATIQDVIKTLPQNFGGGVSAYDFSDSGAGDFNRGSAVNLRGLGVDASLVLINGRRAAASGTNGVFADLSVIPAAAIDRIEVLSDGASAIYGSDAVGGVVNLFLRRDYEGAETQLRLGSLGGDATERQLSQVFGRVFGDLSFLIGYQYYDRDAVERSDRSYAATDDLSAFGGTDFRGIHSTPGNILDPLTGAPAYAIPAGQNGVGLTPADLLPGDVNLEDVAPGVQFLPREKTHSGFFNVRLPVSERLAFFGDGYYSEREIHQKLPPAETTFPLIVPDTNPFLVDPFGFGFDAVTRNFGPDFGLQDLRGKSRSLSVAAGADFKWGGQWQLTSTLSYGRTESDSVLDHLHNEVTINEALARNNAATAFNPYADGPGASPDILATLETSQIEHSTAFVKSVGAVLNGPLFKSLPAGQAQIALGVDYRDEGFGTEEIFADAPFGSRSPSRQVSAAFAELVVPLVSSANVMSGVRSLQLSLAGRGEQYSDFGDTFNPKVGIAWSPVDRLTFRGSWGTSFKAPRLIDVTPTLSNTFDFVTSFPDPQSASGLSTTLARFGRNANLRPEEADAWTVGIDYEPPSVWPRIALNYFNIVFDGRIAGGGPPGNPFGTLLDESTWAPIIVRGPTAEQVAAVCNSGFFFGGTVDDCLASAPEVIVDLRLRNLASVETDGLDLELEKAFAVPMGRLHASVAATYTFNFENAITSTSPTNEFVDTVGNVPSLRARGALLWDNGPWTTSAYVNFTGRYDDPLTTPVRQVASLTTFDLGLSYRLGGSGNPDDGLRVAANVNNVFDRDPPFANVRGAGFDTANGNPYGRFMSVNVLKSW